MTSTASNSTFVLAPQAEPVLALMQRIKTRIRGVSGSPAGECFNASVALGLGLAQMGITPHMVKGDVNGLRHFWLVAAIPWLIDGVISNPNTILDVTAHQFPNFKDILICPVSQCKTHERETTVGLHFHMVLNYLHGDKDE